ncbi:tripartite motif-containing protein 16-like [Brienomyrus brachyistius]|uniref:tripartite motif-containing protein 16-like n=1 Tax=Brienomyrus brachyistius TaxID=42636 RepID=UPI0020B30C9A|nr:tripartite motif-containing protein 16-like [Brienomyrus brachyistius]
MAQFRTVPNKLSCPICHKLLKEPLTISCGHTYCMGCINGYWMQYKDDCVRFKSCPECTEDFNPRPVVNRNCNPANTDEKVNKTGPQASPPPCHVGPGDVECSACVGKKHKAVKTCLMCLASYCETHLRHHESLAFKDHKLINAIKGFQGMICSVHNKVLDIYCCTDQQCICSLCTTNDHKYHDTVLPAKARNEKRQDLLSSQREINQRIQEREKELQELREAVQSLKLSAKTAVEDSERIFNEMIRYIERRHSEVNKLIRGREQAAESQAKGLLEKLEKEIAELRRRNWEIEQLSFTEDDINFLQGFQPLCDPYVSQDLPTITVMPNCYFDDVREVVLKLREQLESICKDELSNISKQETAFSIVLPLAPQTREEFLIYACKLTFDPATANACISLSDGNRHATAGCAQSCLAHPERFDSWPQVLSKEDLSGCCYWEVEWGGEDGVDIAVSYKEISRKDNESKFGCNAKSWSLHCSPSTYSFRHNNKEIPIHGPLSSKIGVFLDHRAGILSFYSVSDTMTLLQRMQTKFTEPLHLGCSIYSHSVPNLTSDASSVTCGSTCSNFLVTCTFAGSSSLLPSSSVPFSSLLLPMALVPEEVPEFQTTAAPSIVELEEELDEPPPAGPASYRPLIAADPSRVPVSGSPGEEWDTEVGVISLTRLRSPRLPLGGCPDLARGALSAGCGQFSS